LKTNTTDDLIERALTGQSSAFDELYERFSSRLARYVRERIAGRVASRVEPEDIVQETFAEVFTRMGRVEPRGRGTFFRLLTTIARRRIVDVDRRLATRHENAVPSQTTIDDLEAAEWLRSKCTGPLTALLRSEERDLCRRAFDELPARAREILWMRLVEERGVAEISRLTGKSVGAIWVWFHRALKAWATRFNELRGE